MLDFNKRGIITFIGLKKIIEKLKINIKNDILEYMIFLQMSRKKRFFSIYIELFAFKIFITLTVKIFQIIVRIKQNNSKIMDCICLLLHIMV